MKLVDYTGKLNTHKEYIEMLKKLEKYTDYIEIVILDEKESNTLIDKFKKDVIFIKKVSNWWGTKTTAINNLYRIKSSSNFFKVLSSYETFCKYYDASVYKEKDWDELETTDFGIDDIAFYDKNGKYLLFTTTHEGFITINSNLIK